MDCERSSIGAVDLKHMHYKESGCQANGELLFTFSVSALEMIVIVVILSYQAMWPLN